MVGTDDIAASILRLTLVVEGIPNDHELGWRNRLEGERALDDLCRSLFGLDLEEFVALAQAATEDD